MSHHLTSRNPALSKLVQEGYELEFRPGLLLVHAVPYVNAHSQIAYGTLVSELSMDSPDMVGMPGSHQMHFIGDHPCFADGRIFAPVQYNSGDFHLGNDVLAQHHFSHKRKDRDRNWIAYEDYYVKVKTYVDVISGQAKMIDPSVDARTRKVATWVDDTTPFVYADTASTRAGILAINERASQLRVAIVGLGGTGGYVLDLLAPTYVPEIHLFDGDKLHQHNAFRAPGAVPAEALGRHLRKVEWYAEHYGNLRRGVVPHAEMIHEANVHELSKFDYVFLCIDSGQARGLILDYLKNTNTVVIDCGMGMHVLKDEQKLWGTIRTTVSSPGNRDDAASLMPLVDREDDLYRSNVQIIELNALNAAMAVLRWKRLIGMFADDRLEMEGTYNTALNQIGNKPEPL
ncbi:ThiF family adenylyltransferase [Xanthomonas campestris]|uniref:ThiF family adenylyltransferase n=1 Tax=Xanthomonas campestris TaxID=339 RepID=UPI00096DAD5E|nr:ThiF family adenylyltransferase [Xanthomonas campestris]WVL62483.1 ThiF family adenylyltransferase [Xanthomonas campestris pv. barbareae]